MSSSPAIGIDLGTTFCSVGYFKQTSNVVEIIENRLGHKTTPSYVAFTDTDEIVGKLAKDKVLRIPKNVVYDSKRLIGRKFDNKRLQEDRRNWPFEVFGSEDGTPLVQIFRNGKVFKYKPEEISAFLLNHMKIAAEERLETKVKDAVITVPAYFNNLQRKATKEAAKLAGLNVLRIINEPTAAALAYIHKNEIIGPENIVIFDLGGGTLDISVVQLEEDFVTVRATCGNTHLGGRDFEKNLSDLIVSKILMNYNKDVKDDSSIMGRINHECENLKINLTYETSTNAEFRSLFDKTDVDILITRQEFEDVNENLFENCLNTVNVCLKDANLRRGQIDAIVLIGGSTRIPKIQTMLGRAFGKELLVKTVNPEEGVAYGAAVQASILKRNKNLKIGRVVDVTNLSLGTDVNGGIMEVVIPRNTPIPVIQTNTYFTVADKQQVADINIYEGEHSLNKYNTKLGTCIMELPPRPPGYSMEVSFHIDSNGILDVGTQTDKGLYKNLCIQYGNLQRVNDDTNYSKKIEGNVYRAVVAYKNLQNYCTRMQALCTYDKQGMTFADKGVLTKSCEYYSTWLKANQVTDGRPEELKAIICMQKAMEVVCEPVANKYNCYIKEMSWEEFYKCITE